jgi:hypothetical protein
MFTSWGVKMVHRGDAETQRKTKSKPESAEVAESAEGSAVPETGISRGKFCDVYKSGGDYSPQRRRDAEENKIKTGERGGGRER